MKLLFDLIFRNWLYKITAFLLACVLWMAAQGIRSEEQSLDLPVTFMDVPETVVVVDQNVREVNLRIVGSRAALRRAERVVDRYPVSLRGVNAGEAHFEVSLDRVKLPRGARVSARSPSSLILQLDSVVRKRVPVRLDLAGELGPELGLTSVRVEPPEVVVEGARKSVGLIREVMTERVDLARFSESATLEVPLVFGQSHVWRADERENSVTVKLQIERRAEAPPAGPDLPGAETGRVRPAGERAQGEPT